MPRRIRKSPKTANKKAKRPAKVAKKRLRRASTVSRKKALAGKRAFSGAPKAAARRPAAPTALARMTALPFDYPPVWYDRWYSEQYLLACWLLGGDNLRVELPVGYLSHAPTLHATLQPLWDDPALAGAATFGGAFWFSIAAQRA